MKLFEQNQAHNTSNPMNAENNTLVIEDDDDKGTFVGAKRLEVVVVFRVVTAVTAEDVGDKTVFVVVVVDRVVVFILKVVSGEEASDVAVGLTLIVVVLVVVALVKVVCKEGTEVAVTLDVLIKPVWVVLTLVLLLEEETSIEPVVTAPTGQLFRYIPLAQEPGPMFNVW